MSAKVLSLADFKSHRKPYPFEIEGFGTVMLHALTHGQRQDILRTHFDPEGKVIDFQALRDAIVLAAVAEPALTADDLADFGDDVEFVQKVYTHTGVKAGIINPPKEDAKEGEGASETDAPLPTSNS